LGRSVPVEASHAGGRGARAVHRKFILGVRRQGGKPEGGSRWWGVEYRGAGSSGRAHRRLPRPTYAPPPCALPGRAPPSASSGWVAPALARLLHALWAAPPARLGPAPAAVAPPPACASARRLGLRSRLAARAPPWLGRQLARLQLPPLAAASRASQRRPAR
jgi:hypothetical protein